MSRVCRAVCVINTCIHACAELVNLHKTTLSQYAFFRQLELNRPLMAPADTPSSQGTVAAHTYQEIYNPIRRGEIMVWLIGIMDLFQMLMSSRTVYFAVALIDSYLLYKSTKPLAKTSEIRLVAATCLYIASKCEDVSHIGINNLAFDDADNENSFDATDILHTEEMILSALDFDIYIPTIIDYIHIYTNCIPEMIGDVRFTFFAKYLAEICLVNWKFLRYAPSRIATSICVYSFLCLGHADYFPLTLANLSFYLYDDLSECLQAVQKAHILMSQHTMATVHRRYSKPENGNVAQILFVGNIP